jgi:hypothetical protein
MFFLEISSAAQESQIIDEGVHLTAGYSYLMNKYVELNPEHPPLVKLAAALLIWPLHPNFPFTDLANANQWDVAGKFLYDVGNNADLMLFLGRLPAMFFSLLLGLIIYIWAKKISGVYAGFIALILYAFDANILTHSRYITTDIAISLFFIATLYCLSKYLVKPSTNSLIVLAICFSLAQVTKFSAVLLIPLILFFGLYAKISAKQYLKMIAVLLFSTALAIAIFYFFQPLPYLNGLLALFDHEKGGHFSYLLGQFDEHGFWYYFPVAFLVKTPLTTLLILLSAIIIFILSKLEVFRNLKSYSFFRRIKKTIAETSLEKWIIIVFPIFYFAAAMVNRLNIGIRHLLPIYPFIFIFIAVTIFSKKYRNIYLKIASIFLIAFFLIESLIIYPNYLPYFSLLVGGTSQGHKYLLDSNLDWGQDLKKLKKYLEENNITKPIYLSYFGKASPDYYGISYFPLPDNNLPNGYVAISIQHIESTDAKYQFLLDYKPEAIIGKTIYLYRIQK